MAIDPVSKKIGDSGIKLPLDNPGLLEALQKSSAAEVHKLLANMGLTAVDFEEFAADQHNKYINAVVQPDPLYEGYAAIPPPDLNNFFMQDMRNAFDPADTQAATTLIEGAIKSKSQSGMKLGKMQGGKASLETEVQDAQNSLSDFNDFWNREIEPRIFEMQLTQQLQNKTAELEREYERILAMARSGQIDDPSVLIIAMTKITVERQGFTAVHLGRRLWRYNDESNRITKELQNSAQFDKDAIVAQSEMRGLSMHMTELTSGIQAVTNNVAQAEQTANTMIGQLNATKTEMIKKIGGG